MSLSFIPSVSHDLLRFHYVPQSSTASSTAAVDSKSTIKKEDSSNKNATPFLHPVPNSSLSFQDSYSYTPPVAQVFWNSQNQSPVLHPNDIETINASWHSVSTVRNHLRSNSDASSTSSVMSSSLVDLCTSPSGSTSFSFESPSDPSDEPEAQKVFKSRKKHFCEICQKSFERPSTLSTHMNSHTGAKPFVCTVPGCHRRFSVRSNMRRHMSKCACRTPKEFRD